MAIVSAGSGPALAAEEYRFLLARGYPREQSLVMVGNRHDLGKRERELLRRAVLAPERAEARRARLSLLKDLRGERVGLDGHNVIITLESALAGRDLVLGDDGVVRDIARAGGSYSPGGLTLEALGLILRTLASAKADGADFYLDSPISRSGELAATIREELGRTETGGTARAVPVPEKELKAYPGIVASSDGELIEACQKPLDLAGWIIRERLEEVPIIGF